MRSPTVIRLLLVGIPLALLASCATGAPAQKPAVAVAPSSSSSNGGPSPRAMLLFEDATKAAEAQAKSNTRNDAALERRFEAVRDADPSFAERKRHVGDRCPDKHHDAAENSRKKNFHLNLFCRNPTGCAIILTNGA